MTNSEKTNQTGGNILLVDDVPANLTLLGGMLKGKGYRVRPVPSGRLALKAIEHESPDLILLDITMPEMDGYEVCRKLKEDSRFKDIPVIFISALTETLDMVKAFGSGGVDYITKPFQFAEVEARVETHLKLSRYRVQLSQANEIISRYIAEQLVREIQEGHHRDVATPRRCYLTMVFTDIVRFSETVDEIRPENLSILLNDYFAEMTSVAEKYGATIDKFIGDGMFCFFGAPTATNDRDHAYRAVKMALEMNERVDELNSSWSGFGATRPLLLRIGVNTGIAIVGSFGSKSRMNYTAVGRHVNIAARLEENCEPGNVLISRSTYELVRDRISCVEKGEMRVKGIHDPVRVYFANSCQSGH
jgi:class 3 adenylate cyclase